MSKPRLLLISEVLPFPVASGQQQRVALTLTALRSHFWIHFLTSSAPKEELLEYCDEVTLIGSRYRGKNFMQRLYWRLRGLLYTWRTGLKFSNFRVELDYLDAAMPEADIVLFEYFHAHRLAAQFQARGVPTVLDMHDILWKSYERQLSHYPKFWRERQVALYKAQEEAAWQDFDWLIAITLGEMAYVQERHSHVFYAPMGIDLAQWPYCWQPSERPRIAYYGALGSPHNQADARFCYEAVMPRIWEVYPDAELWLIGSNPPQSLQNIRDERVHVTGYVADLPSLLKNISLVLCPFTGQYGFRSRLIEVMALGLPVIASADAVHGMDLENVILADTAETMAEASLGLLRNMAEANAKSVAARQEIEAKFTFESSYARLANKLLDIVR